MVHFSSHYLVVVNLEQTRRPAWSRPADRTSKIVTAFAAKKLPVDEDDESSLHGSFLSFMFLVSHSHVAARGIVLLRCALSS